MTYMLFQKLFIAQRLLEGQAYGTITLVPNMVYKIMKALLQSIEIPNSAMYIRSIATEMLQVFNNTLDRVNREFRAWGLEVS